MLQKTPAAALYLIAAELCITERERAGLIKVRDDLASGRVKYYDMTGRGTNSWRSNASSDLFSMRSWNCFFSDCGTVHCIGGFMHARGACERDDYSEALYRLFEPASSANEWLSYTPSQAVRAIDYFLAGHGDECWPLALADIPL